MKVIFENYVKVVGTTWEGFICYSKYDLTPSDIKRLVLKFGSISRESLSYQVRQRTEDFVDIHDISAIIDNAPGEPLILPWATTQWQKYYRGED